MVVIEFEIMKSKKKMIKNKNDEKAGMMKEQWGWMVVWSRRYSDQIIKILIER